MVFATGRNHTECRDILRDVDHFDNCVFVGGAVVMDVRRNVTLQRTLMEPGLAREICDVFEKHGHAVLALQDTHHAGVDYLITDRRDLNAATTDWLRLTNATCRRHEGSLERHDHSH